MQCWVGGVGSLPEQRGRAWESVVEDGELVVGGSMVCVGSGKPGKKRRRHASNSCLRRAATAACARAKSSSAAEQCT